MTKKEAQDIITQAEDAKHDPGVPAPNTAQVALAHKTIRGLVKEGEVLTGHPVTGEPVSVEEHDRVRACLAAGTDWKEDAPKPKKAGKEPKAEKA